MDIKYLLCETAENKDCLYSESPSLVRSRTTSDASSTCSNDCPETPRDDPCCCYYPVATPSLSTSACATTTTSMTRPTRRSRSATQSTTTSVPVQTRMAWTPYEDELLQQGYDEGLSWAMISATYLPHRSRGCCWGRFKTLQSKNLIDPKRQSARLFRRPWKAVDNTTKRP